MLVSESVPYQLDGTTFKVSFRIFVGFENTLAPEREFWHVCRHADLKETHLKRK